MTASSTPEDTIAECKRRVAECYALSETTVVPEYREALSAMAKAWMKIAQGEQAGSPINQIRKQSQIVAEVDARAD
jgi:hypothetical protein